ncbi:MAG: hypothetical protein FK733_19020 [Asgard group archaeon]|nr:hypothetical protein [Asgard group archaeon]
MKMRMAMIIMKMSRKNIIVIVLIIFSLFIAEMSIFLNNNRIYKYKNYTLIQNSNMEDYHLGNESFFDDEDIEYISQAGDYTSANTYDLTNIALRGCLFYYDYLRTNETKFAQLTLYYANFLLSEGNFIDKGEYILFPSHLGYTVFKFTVLRKKYEDAMGASFAAILFINTDELLTKLNITNNYYLESSSKVVKGILLSHKYGGGKKVLSNDEVWFIHHNEENMVLNGHMFTIANLIRYMNYTSDFSPQEDINKGINSLKNTLYLYLRENKQLYDLKLFVEDTGYDPYFAPYYRNHPLLLYYLYKNTLDVELFDFYLIFMESSLYECKYELDSNPYLVSDELYLNLSMISNVNNLFSSITLPYQLSPTPDYYYRYPIIDFDLLNSISLNYTVKTNDGKEFEGNVLTNFTSDLMFNINSSESVDINIQTLTYEISIDCQINLNQLVIEEKSIKILDVSKNIQFNKRYGVTIIYEFVIIMICLFAILIMKYLKK